VVSVREVVSAFREDRHRHHKRLAVRSTIHF
jgi:hypothetical protein